ALVDLFESLLFLDRCPFIPAAFEESDLPLQLQVRCKSVCVQGALLHCSLDAATRVGLMTAIAKAAEQGQLLDVCKGLRHTVAAVSPQLQLTQPRRVHQERTAWGKENTSRGSRMATPAVVFPHGAGGLNLSTQQVIDQR